MPHAALAPQAMLPCGPHAAASDPPQAPTGVAWHSAGTVCWQPPTVKGHSPCGVGKHGVIRVQISVHIGAQVGWCVGQGVT